MFVKTYGFLRLRSAVQLGLMAVMWFDISALPLNFCNKKQEIEAGTWVAGIALFSKYHAFIEIIISGLKNLILKNANIVPTYFLFKWNPPKTNNSHNGHRTVTGLLQPGFSTKDKSGAFYLRSISYKNNMNKKDV